MGQRGYRLAIDTTGFRTVYGRGLVPKLTRTIGRYAVVVHPEPWATVAPAIDAPPHAVVPAGELTPSYLEALLVSMPAVDAIVGLGGGSAMDTAKWLHGRLGLPLYQVPSLPSVNACFTRMTALRDAGGVRYEGDAVPEEVLVDFDLMASAPPALVRGGIGDVLSCHTARFDWRLAAAAGRDHPWDEEAAAASLAYLEELEDLAPLLATGEDEGVRRLMECHRDIGSRCHELGHARFEEGSEHFLAYAFEAVTGRTIMHGELVTLGVLVMSALQGNDPERPRRITDLAGTRTGLDELVVGWEEVEATLCRLPTFVEEQHLWYSVANGLTVGQEELETARRALRFRP
jgi:glycerol dehydrogenase-like iron-containing ADH family enzyme